MPFVTMSLVVFTALFTRVFVVDEKLCTRLKNHPENRADREISFSFFQSLANILFFAITVTYGTY